MTLETFTTARELLGGKEIIPRARIIAQEYLDGHFTPKSLLEKANELKDPRLSRPIQALEEALQVNEAESSFAATNLVNELFKITAPLNETKVREIITEATRPKRLSSTIREGGIYLNGRMEEASRVTRGVREATKGDGRTVAEIRGVEEQTLEAYAKEQGIWFEDLDAALKDKYLAAGSESRVYTGEDGTTVIKGNDGGIYPNWAVALRSFELHNMIFPGVAVDVIGFGIVTDFAGEKRFGVALEQGRVNGPGFTSKAEFESDLKARDFVPFKQEGNVVYGAYTNGTIRLEDIHGKNVLKGSNGGYYYIDTQVFLESESKYTPRN